MSTEKRKTQSTRKISKKRIKKMDMYLIGAVLYITAWSIAFFIAWIALEQEPTILEGCILAPGVVEMVACAWIKRAEPKTKTSAASDTQLTDFTEGGSDGSAT